MAAGDSQIRRLAYRFRDGLEAAVVERAGTVTIAQASTIHTAAVHLRKHLQAERRLAKDGATLPLADWLALATASTRFKEGCDRALRLLGLDPKAKEPNAFDVFMRKHEAAEQAKALQAAPPASASTANRPESHPAVSNAPAGQAQLANGIPEGEHSR